MDGLLLDHGLAFPTLSGDPQVLLILAVTAPVALSFGFAGASAARSEVAPIRWFGRGYIAIVRGVPDIAFFMFFVIALDQGFEWIRHQLLCPDWEDPIRQDNDFLVCPSAKLPLGIAPEWQHELYALFLAVLTFSIVFGAFATNVLYGGRQSVPRTKTETAAAYGMSRRQTFWRIIVPQMWVYALPGHSNLWMILIKPTPVLFLLVLYLTFTHVSEIVLGRINQRLSRGQATLGGTGR